jgi:cysteine synthase
MNMSKTSIRASDALAQPRMVRLSSNLFAVCLEVMKIIPARHILARARAEGLIDADTLIVESSSGNLALGLAVVCREMGLRLHIVGDPAIDPPLRNLLANLGARVDIIERPDGYGSFQRLRLARVHQVLAETPKSFWIRQYDNVLNAQAYGALAATLAAEFGPRLNLVAAVGSGGSSVGLSTELRALGVDVRLAGVDTFNSVLFGLPDGKRSLRGLGNSVMPGILDHTQFDEIHWLGGELANRAAMRLHREHALFCGPTSGAAFHVASHVAAGRPEVPTAFIAADTGYRYQGSVFAGDWAAGEGASHTSAHDGPAAPRVVAHPAEVDAHGEWTCLPWGRRSLAELAGAAGHQPRVAGVA